jgi:hypothetical protein
MGMLAFFNLGPAEIIILGVIGLMGMVAVVAVVILVVSSSGSGRPPDERGD